MGKFIKKFKNKDKNSLIKRGHNAKKAFIFLALFLFVTSPVKVSANPGLDNKILETQRSLNQATQERVSLSREVANIESRIISVQSQINNTQNEIAIINADITKTQTQISEKEQRISTQQSRLKDLIREQYQASQASTLEIFIKSESLSDFVGRAEYSVALQNGVKNSADALIALREDLKKEEKRLELNLDKNKNLSSSLLLQRKAIEANRLMKNKLLVEARGQERGIRSELNSLIAYRDWLDQQGGGGGGVPRVITGYPYASHGFRTGTADKWGFFTRECTSYAAWRSSLTGPISARMLRTWGTTRYANGGQWLGLAKEFGLNTSRIPQPNSIMVFPVNTVGGVGHVAYVESVNPNGTVNISEYNWREDGRHGKRAGVNPVFFDATFIVP